MKNKTPDEPTSDTVRNLIEKSPTPLTRREIARALGFKNEGRIELKDILRQLVQDGVVEKDRGKSYRPAQSLPETLLVEITGLDQDGEMRAKPVTQRQDNDAPPVIFVLDRTRHEGELKPGDQVLARLKRVDGGAYTATILKMLDDAPGIVIGVFKSYKTGGFLLPVDKKDRSEYVVPPEHRLGAQDGELVVAKALPPQGQSGKRVGVTERLGAKDDPKLISLIAIHAHGVPYVFPPAALKEAEMMQEPTLEKGRVDLRDIPLVTIDGIDARDFDDAVFAEEDKDGGWNIIVAIADVSYYVRPGTALDRAALERGNSTYFPDRVAPMLPERLSNDLCSLRPRVDRACLAAHMRIDPNGRLIERRFSRALMRSVARLTYEEVEDAHQGRAAEKTTDLMDRVIRPLYKAYSVLKRAREVRGALEIDLPERKAQIDEHGRVTAIVPRQRLASHQLIEEFMILANVAAAEVLEEKNAPCLYRIHEGPAPERLEATREFLKEVGISLPKTRDLHPKSLNHILTTTMTRDDKELIHTVLLRTQSQAAYSPDNIGHFGLALDKYAHFTSPIRRYADLVVHRSLVRACRLGTGGLDEDDMQALQEIAAHISQTERRSMLAERDSLDRFTAQYLHAHVGAEFKGRINSVTRFGLFVKLDETGADGIVPMRSLPQDYYIHDEKRHALVGKRSGRTFRLADPVIVRLLEADSLRGSTVFELVLSFNDTPTQPRGGFTRQKKGAFKGAKKSRKGRRR